jgi:hypothetical protein
MIQISKKKLPVVKGLVIITTLIIKSLLTSLCQREELPLFEKEGGGEILSSDLECPAAGALC